MAFYKVVDTTHLYHSIESEAWAYEWAGTNFVSAARKHEDKIITYSHNNAATHSSLVMTITKDNCIPTIELSSITSKDKKIYKCKSGQIEIDKRAMEQDILKANFDIVFDHTENPDQEMFWKGKIYTKIEND